MIRHALRNYSILKKPAEPSGEAAGFAGQEYPRSVYYLFLFFVLYLTLPLVDVPFLGLSLSAPVFFLIALPVILRPAQPWIAAYRRWIMMAALIWAGMLLSAVLNGLFSGGTQIDTGGIVALVQFSYWLLVFVVTVYLVSSQEKLAQRLVSVIAVGIALLAFIRLGEAVFSGAIGAWTRLQFMTQNGYAIQFSMFYPVLLSFVYWGPRKKLAGMSALLMLAAILINGSRTGWLAALISTSVFLWMLLRTQRQRMRSVVVLLFLAGTIGLGSLLAPSNVISAFESRLDTFQSLENDKSYAIRQLMVQKGILLFQSNPLTGVGISRWRKESVPLEIPRVLQYSTQAYYDNKSSHNSYVSFLAENGLLGSLPFGFLLLTLALRGYQTASGLARRGQVWALGIYAGFLGMSVHLWALSGLTGTAPWFVYGLVAAMIVLERKSFLDKESDSNAPRFLLPHPRRF